MTPGKLYRISSWSLCIGAVIFMITNTAGSIAFTLSIKQTSPFWISVQVVSIIAAVCFSLGLPAVYLYQAKETKLTGLFGFVLIQAANIIGNVGYSLVIAIVTATLSTDILKKDGALAFGLYTLSTLSSLFLFVGSCLFGLAIINGKVFPRYAGIILLIASIAALAEACPIPSLGVTIGLLSQLCSYAVFVWIGAIVIRAGRILDIEQGSSEIEPAVIEEEITQ